MRRVQVVVLRALEPLGHRVAADDGGRQQVGTHDVTALDRSPGRSHQSRAASCRGWWSSRPGAVAERREVHVVAGARADGAQQGAVDPGHDASRRACPGRGSPCRYSSMCGHEDVLHLQVPARMEQRQRVGEALGGAAREVEADVVGRAREQILEMLRSSPGGSGASSTVVERAQPLLEPKASQTGSPERHAALAVAEAPRGRPRAGARPVAAGRPRARRSPPASAPAASRRSGTRAPRPGRAGRRAAPARRRAGCRRRWSRWT